MRTLKDHTIYYDAVCPMCNAYTCAFVRTGMLDTNGRGTYQDMQGDYSSRVDMKKAVNEIALVNRKTGQVYYGIESMFLVIGHSFPLLKPLFASKLFKWMANKIYKFISFNRRVIIPSDKDLAGQCPSFHAGYRVSWLVFTWITTAFVLLQYSEHMTSLIPESNYYREFMICGGQIFWQLFFISWFNKKKAWDYFGNMMTISFAGALALLPGMIILNILNAPAIYYSIYFMLVAGLMLLEHMRRVSILHINYSLTITWVLYRLIILIIILYA